MRTTVTDFGLFVYIYSNSKRRDLGGSGDLGKNAAEVERSLVKIVKMTTKWGAVLLLNEADVYIKARSSSDFERNKLLSILP